MSRRRAGKTFTLLAALLGALAVTAPAAVAGTPAAGTTESTYSRLTPSANSAYYYQDVTYTVHVVDAPRPGVVPTGTVTFFVNTANGWTASGTRSLDKKGNAQVTLQNFNYPIPDMPVRAHYNGAAHLGQSTSNTVDVDSKQIPVKLAISPAPVPHGDAIYVEAVPNPNVAGFNPPKDGLNGIFSIFEGSHELNFVYRNPDFEGFGYKARITTVLPVGNHRLDISFSPFNSAAAFDVYGGIEQSINVKVVPHTG